MNVPVLPDRYLAKLPSHRSDRNTIFRRFLVGLPLVAVLALATAACGAPAAAKSVSSPSATTTPKTSASAPSSDPSSDQAELAAAQELLPNLKANPGENRNDVLLATYRAIRYANTIYNSGYLANGSWAKNGGSADDLHKLFGQDWSDSFRAKIDRIVADYHSPDAGTQSGAQSSLMYYMFFTDSSMGSSIKAPDDCNQNDTGAPTCLRSGNPTFDKEVTYQVNQTTGSIYVNATFTDNVRVIKDGASGISPVHYDLQFEMVKNPHPGLGRAYLVNDLGGSWKIDKWSQQS